MVKLASNRKAVIADLDRKVRIELLSQAVRFERILQEEFRKPKTGRVYGEESKVEFGAMVEYTANKGEKAKKRTIAFVANRGRKWKTGGKNRGMHRASAPGEAPAIQTGAYRKGIAHAARRLGPLRYSIVIGVTIQSGRGAPTKSGRSIAEILEFGGKNVEPRPGWRLAIEQFKRGYKAITAKKSSAKKGR